MAKPVISKKNRERLRRTLAKPWVTAPALLADALINSKWLREMLAEAWDRGWEASEKYGYPIEGADSDVYKNPWRD